MHIAARCGQMKRSPSVLPTGSGEETYVILQVYFGPALEQDLENLQVSVARSEVQRAHACGIQGLVDGKVRLEDDLHIPVVVLADRVPEHELRLLKFLAFSLHI